MTTHTDDLTFVEKVVGGDREAAELFLYRCQLWTGQLARMSGISTQEWGDLSNEALLTALGQMRRGLFRGDSSFQTWAEKIIRGKIADYWRTRGSDNRYGALVSIESGLNDYQEEVERNVSLIQSLALQRPDHEMRLMVRQALRSMSRQHAMVLLLNVREGYSTVEIGDKLDLPPGTVGRKLAEAKRQFRRFFSDTPQGMETAESDAQVPKRRSKQVQQAESSRNPIFSPVLLWLIPTTRWRSSTDVPRRSFMTPLPITASATPMKTNAAWWKSI